MITTNTDLNRLIAEQDAPGIQFSDREMRIMDIALAAQKEAERLAVTFGNITQAIIASEQAGELGDSLRARLKTALAQ
jgi:hypothetical protein